MSAVFFNVLKSFFRFHILRGLIGDFGPRVFDLRPVGEAHRPETVGVEQQLGNRRHLGESAHHASSEG